MSTPPQVLSVLSLCVRPPSDRVAEDRPLRDLVATFSHWDVLIDTAEQHGMEMLLLAHLRARGAPMPARAQERLHARWMQHGHACAVRTRAVADLTARLEAVGIHGLLLKGAALASLVYDDPRHRPMRDIDVLVRPSDASRAYKVLRGTGFKETQGELSPSYHHLPGLTKQVDGVTIVIELHVRLLRDTALLARIDYDTLLPRAQTCAVGTTRCQSLGREDQLWHIYAHAFAIDVLCPATRLISLADLVHATERWADTLEWDRLRRLYPRLIAALTLIDDVVPWSAAVRERLGLSADPSRARVQVVTPSMSPMTSARGVWRRDVWWPSEWWFRMRYGILGRGSLVWFRMVGHPLRVLLAGLDTFGVRLAKRWRPHRPHELLARK